MQEETTVCKEGGGGKCKRDADAIRKVLGLVSLASELAFAVKLEVVDAGWKGGSLEVPKQLISFCFHFHFIENDNGSTFSNR